MDALADPADERGGPADATAAATDDEGGDQLNEERSADPRVAASRRRRRNVALGLALVGLAVLFYAVSTVRVGEQLARRGAVPPPPPADMGEGSR